MFLWFFFNGFCLHTLKQQKQKCFFKVRNLPLWFFNATKIKCLFLAYLIISIICFVFEFFVCSYFLYFVFFLFSDSINLVSVTCFWLFWSGLCAFRLFFLPLFAQLCVVFNSRFSYVVLKKICVFLKNK